MLSVWGVEEVRAESGRCTVYPCAQVCTEAVQLASASQARAYAESVAHVPVAHTHAHAGVCGGC